mmetsp:Transcript_3041/g.12297  ORF Transcript_3041/g.12297 Transcript_3041/m.12297 type:complete len:137 (-) Transcript_3041:817-1227(-)
MTTSCLIGRNATMCRSELRGTGVAADNRVIPKAKRRLLKATTGKDGEVGEDGEDGEDRQIDDKTLKVDAGKLIRYQYVLCRIRHDVLLVGRRFRRCLIRAINNQTDPKLEDDSLGVITLCHPDVAEETSKRTAASS